MLEPDLCLASRLFATLHAATQDAAGGVTRDAYGAGERAAHDLVRAEGMALGLGVTVDLAGNPYLTLPGRDRRLPRIVLGSHLDSVPQGGDYDGTAGVVAGLVVAAGLRAAAFMLPRDVVVMAIRAEEAGAWFPFGCPGRRAALGTLPPHALDVARLDTGRSLAAHMRDEGLDPDAVRAGALPLDPVVPVGIVTGIPGSRRHRFGRVLGRWDHSGAAPRRFCSDAALAAAELTVRLDEAWAGLMADGHGLVCTMCVLPTSPQAGFGKVAGEAMFRLDTRSISQAALDGLFAALHRLVPDIEAKRRVRIELGPESAGAPTPMDKAVCPQPEWQPHARRGDADGRFRRCVQRTDALAAHRHLNQGEC